MPQKITSASAAATGSSAERSLRLLAHLAETGRALSLAELAEHLALPKATAHRLCMQLLDTGFIARDVKERDYVVGPALRELAFNTLNHGTLRGLRHEVLADLVAEIGETCNLTTLDGATVLYLDRVEAPWPWRLTLATPYFATSASSPSIAEACALSASISTANRRWPSSAWPPRVVPLAAMAASRWGS
ncbi:MAG: helix-turn-helix domain-containing protein, partial [Pseudomonadota bacterium]